MVESQGGAQFLLLKRKSLSVTTSFLWQRGGFLSPGGWSWRTNGQWWNMHASWQGKFNQDTGPGDRWLSNFRSTTLMSCYWSFTSLTAQIYDPEEFWTVKKTLTDNSLTNSPRCIYTTATNYFYHSREKPVTSVKSKCAYIYDQVKLQSTLRYCVVLQ